MMIQALKIIPAEELVSLSLDLPESQSFDEWLEVGRNLASGSKALNWWIGDWWAAGSHRYGARAKAAAEGIFGREFQTLVNLGNVSRSFASNRRRLDLSFTHHAEVASLSSDRADALLDRAANEGWSARDLRRAAAPRVRDTSAAEGLGSELVQLQTPSLSAEIEAEARRLGKSLPDFLGMLIALGWSQYSASRL